MNQNNQQSRGNNAAQSGSNQNGKWALNVQDIIKRTHQNMQQEKRLNSDSSDLMNHQKSTSSQNLNAEGGQRMRTLQQQSQDAYDPMSRGKSRERASNEKLNTIQHPQSRKSNQQRNKGAQGSAAAQVIKQNQVFAKQSIENDTNNHQKSRQSNQGPGSLSAEPSTQGQGGRQGTTSSLAQKNQTGQGQRGTTPLRMGKQNTAKSSNAGVAGQVPQKVGQTQYGAKKQHPQTTQNASSKTKTNNQQIKGIMAAALASVKANQSKEMSTLPHGVTKSQQKMLKNNADLDSNRQDQFLNLDNDSNDLKILKASSVNNKYMTELIQGQRIMPEDMRAPGAAKDLGSEYINTDEDEENPPTVPIHKQHSSPLRQSAYSRPPKSEERKVFSQQDYNEIQVQEQFDQYPMGQIGSGEERGRSQGMRPQSSYLPKNYSVERQPPNKVAFTDQKIPKKHISSPQKDQQDVLRLLQKHETSQSQLNQRLDIFEEEIIKRVREIQKYSKGLNSLVRKSVMPDLQAVQEKVIGLALSPAPIGGDRVGVLEDQIVQIQQQIEMQKVMVKNMQLNMGADIKDKYSALQQQMENLQGGGDEEIQSKLVEQNQLIGMLDEQMNTQEQQIQAIQQAIAERDETIRFLQENQNQQPVGQNPDMSGILNEFEESISSQLQAKFSEMELKLQSIEQNQLKSLEDSEGRDGLILQQNQDITNLYQANEQILENEKAFKVQIESMEAQMMDYNEILENQGVQKDQSSQIEGLKHNIEGRLQICIKQLQSEMMQTNGQLQEALEEKIQQIKEFSENMQHNFVQQNKNLQILQENSQSLELQFQAQFDEQNSQQDYRLKQMEHNIQKSGGGSSNLQDIEAIYSKIEALENQQSPQIELILEKIDQLESQQDIETFNQRILALENKDVFAVFETKMSPFANQIEDLQIEITSKCLELSTQQDSQVNSLILEIKQIQENFEQLQDIVVQTTQDVQGLQKDDFSDTLAQFKLDIEQFKTQQEERSYYFNEEIQKNSRLISEVQQKDGGAANDSKDFDQINQALKALKEQITSHEKSQVQIIESISDIEQQLSQKEASSDLQSTIDAKFTDFQIEISTQSTRHFELKEIVSQLEEQILNIGQAPKEEIRDEKFEEIENKMIEEQQMLKEELTYKIEQLRLTIQERQPVQDEQLQEEVQKLQQQIQKLESQQTNIQQVQEKLNQVELNVRNELQQYSRTSDVERGLDKFENVASRTSDVRQDLQAQVDELAHQVNTRKPVFDEELRTQVQALEARLQETLNELQGSKPDQDVALKLAQQVKQKMEILDEDFIDLQSQVRVIESDLQTSLDQVRNTKTSPAQTSDVDEKLVIVSKKISDLENKVSLESKSTNAKIDVLSMDVQSLRNFEKQTRSSSVDILGQVERIEQQIKGFIKSNQLAVLFKEQLDPCTNDITTMKHLINILQDSNFQAQIDEIRKSINDAKMRFSMPMPSSMQVNDEQEFKSVHSKKSKQPSATKSKPRDLDLSPIGQNQEKKFGETDDELKSKLQNMFPEKSGKRASQPFDQGFDEDEIEEYDHDDFEDLPSEPVEDTHEELYEKEVQLPILEDKPPVDSFQNSSKSKVEEQEPKGEEEEAISINSIDLGLMTEEQKEQATNLIMDELDFDSILKVQLEEVMQAIIMRQ